MTNVSKSSFSSGQYTLDVVASSTSPQSDGFTGITPDSPGSSSPRELTLHDVTASVQRALESLTKGRRGDSVAAFQALLEVVPADPNRASTAVLKLFQAIADAHDLIVALPQQAGGAKAHSPVTDEHRFIDVFTAALQAVTARFPWFDAAEVQWHVVEGLPCPAVNDLGHAQSLSATRGMMSVWLSFGYGGTLNTVELAKLISHIFGTVNPTVPAQWIDAMLAGLLDGFTGPPKAERKSTLLNFLGRGDSKASGGGRIMACSALIDCVGHQLHRLTAPQIEAATRSLARHLAPQADPRQVVNGLAHRLLDSLLGYTDSRASQWAAVLTGCRAGLLAAYADRPTPSKADPKRKGEAESKTEFKSAPRPTGSPIPPAHVPAETAATAERVVTTALDALVTWAARHHAERVKRREATLRECVRTGVLPVNTPRRHAPGHSATSGTTESSSSTTTTITMTTTASSTTQPSFLPAPVSSTQSATS